MACVIRPVKKYKKLMKPSINDGMDDGKHPLQMNQESFHVFHLPIVLRRRGGGNAWGHCKIRERQGFEMFQKGMTAVPISPIRDANMGDQIIKKTLFTFNDRCTCLGLRRGNSLVHGLALGKDGLANLELRRMR